MKVGTMPDFMFLIYHAGSAVEKFLQDLVMAEMESEFYDTVREVEMQSLP